MTLNRTRRALGARLLAAAAAACLAVTAGTSARPAEPAQAAKPDLLQTIQLPNWEYRIMVLDELAMRLASDVTARATLVIRADANALPGWACREGRKSYAYLVDARGIDPSRVELRGGAPAESRGLEVWWRPEGAAPVEGTADPCPPVRAAGAALLYDRYWWNRTADEDILGELDYHDQSVRLEGFAAALAADPDATGYLVVRRARRDRAGSAVRFAAGERDYLVRKGVARSRLRVVDWGAADERGIELWVVPRGAAPPRRPR
jgi:hypothetical protein